MASKDDPPSLLSKVALFVRNPTRDWSELDQPSLHEEPGYDKQALQAMIERKRQNDFVRRREFDQLRKLRNRDPAASAAAARQSFFQNSQPTDLDGRAVTLKKIDEIEAQMSRQWWKNKLDSAASAAARLAASAASVAQQNDTVPISQLGKPPHPDAYKPTIGFVPTRPLDSVNGNEFVTTQMSDAMRMSASIAHGAGKSGSDAHSAGGSESEFSVSRLFAMEVDEVATDPELEEAAIRFANGDFAGAEKTLVDALRGTHVAPQAAQSWSAALLDLYRATDQRADFDRAAQEFQVHLDGVHPVWCNLCGAMDGARPRAADRALLWSSPAQLDGAEMQRLQALMAQHPMPWYLGWGELKHITPDALEPLRALFESLGNEPVEASFSGTPQLLQVLLGKTPSGARDVDADWWRLRFGVLQALRLQDDFDAGSIDYCVTYGDTPPDWKDVRCRIDQIEVPAAGDDAGPATAPMDFGEADGLSTLAGEVLGDATEALSGLLAIHGAGQLLQIGCSRLLRVDFAAAGSILNWVAMQESRGRQIQFYNVHRLVAAFFNVIGINEHAKVVPRAI